MTRSRRWNDCRWNDSGTAAIEFAVGSVAFLMFVFAVINIGDFAFTDYSLNRAVEVAARRAAIDASVLIAAQGPLSAGYTVTAKDCPSTATIQRAFDAAATPPWSKANPWPSITVTWWGSMSPCTGQTSSTKAAPAPGGGVTVSASAPWSVIAGDLFGIRTITLSARQSMPVILASSS